MGFCLNEAIGPDVAHPGRLEGIQDTKGQVALPAVYSLVFRWAGRAPRETPSQNMPHRNFQCPKITAYQFDRLIQNSQSIMAPP